MTSDSRRAGAPDYSSFEETGLSRVLAFLKAHDSEYLSGQDLSDVLHISRVAVWKHVRRMRRLGYGVESRQRLGYRLASGTGLPLPWEVVRGAGRVGRRAFYYDTTDSTQARALELAEDPANDGAVVIARRQTGGRGRSGRRWLSPDGGVWMSVILRPRFDVSVATLFPVAASLALAVSVEDVLGIEPELKWPNDLTLGGKKAAGVLVDASLESNRVESIVLGAGINLDVDARAVEAGLAGSPGFYGAASLGGGARPAELVRRFLQELDSVCGMLESGETGPIVSGWSGRSSTIGRDVEIRTASGPVRGRALRIDPDGALVVSGGGGETRVTAGDVTHPGRP